MEVSQAPLRIYRSGKDGKPGEPVENSHPLANLLAHPNERMSGTELDEITQKYLDILGECFWLLDRDGPDEVPRRMWPLPGGSLWQPGPLNEKTGDADEWVCYARGQKLVYQSWQLVVHRYRDPDNLVRGFPPLGAALMNIEADVLADRFSAEFFRTGATPGGVLEFPGPLTPEQIARIRNEWQDTHGGAWNAHRFGILYLGAKWISTSMSQKDMEFISLKEWSREAVAAVFHWPLWMLTDASTSYATAGASRARLWEDTVVPLRNLSASTVETQLVRPMDDGLMVCPDFGEVPALKDQRIAKLDAAGKMHALGVSLHEINDQLGLKLKPQEGWDVAFVPAGMIPVAEALAPPEPTPLLPPAAPPSGGKPAAEPQAPEEDEEESGSIVVEDGETAERAAKRRRLLWRRWHRDVYEPSVAKVKGAVGPYLRELMIEQLKRFESVVREKGRAAGAEHERVLTAADIEAILFESEEWDPILRAAFRETVQQIARTSAAFTELELQKFGRVLDFTSPKVQDFIDERVKKVVQINDATREALARTLEKGFQAGESLAELRLRIEGVSQALSDPARSLRIARTEAGTVTNGIRFQFGEPGDTKSWDSARDDLVRDSHKLAEAESAKGIPIAEPFSNSLLFPHDPGADASEVINCFLPGTTVSGRFVSGLESVYSGPAREIQTARGHRLRLTANHPVLTAGGWRPAHAIRKGDRLLSYRRDVSIYPVPGVDDEHGPARIEDVFESLASQRGGRIRVVGILDLHGDEAFLKGDVYGVGQDREVDRRLNTGLGDHGRDLSDEPFASSDVTDHGLGAAYDFVPTRSASSLSLPHRGHARGDRPVGLLEADPVGALSLGPAAEWDTGFFQNPPDGIRSDTEFTRDLVSASTGLVALDDVVRVRELDWRGHVYDLQSTGGWLMADGIISRNCRCSFSIGPGPA